MRSAVAVALEWIHTVAFAAWFGGILALTAFGGSALLPRFSAAVEWCGLAVIAVQWALRRRWLRSKPLFVADGVRQFLALGALFANEAVRYSAHATMTTWRTAAFGQAGALALAAGITAWLGLAAGRAPAPARSAAQ